MKMRISRTLLALTIISFIVTLFVYNSLPDNIPIHWNISGEADNYAGKGYALVFGAFPILLYFLMVGIPKIDPKKEAYKKHKKSYRISSIAIIIVIMIVHWMSLFKALGYAINISLIVKLIIGPLFIILGNYMTQIRHNYMFGIKTPWTLANEKVWKKTHRVGGYGFIINGLLFLIAIPFDNFISLIPFIFMIILIIGLFVYSYVEFKKMSKE